MQRAKAIWGPEADQFKPERWLADNSTTQKPSASGVSPMPPATHLSQGWSGLFTFLEGPRICIGYRLGRSCSLGHSLAEAYPASRPALFEYKVILTALVKSFEFLPVEGPQGQIETRFSSTMQPYVIGRKDEGVTIPLRVRCIQE